MQEGKEENESISHLGRQILFLRKPHFSDRIRERDRIRLASCLDGKYIPDVGDSSSPAPSIFKTDHCLFDSCQPVGKTEYHSAPHKEHTHTKSLENALKNTPLPLISTTHLFASAAAKLSCLSELLPPLLFSLKHRLLSFELH